MIDIKRIRENPEEFQRAVRKKGAEISVAEILQLDDERRRLISEADALRAEQNAASDKVQGLREGERDETLARLKELKSKIAIFESDMRRVEEELELALYAIPNPPLESVPEGKDEQDNVVLREEGEKLRFPFEPKDYLTLAENLGVIDVEAAGKVSGSRFGYIKADAALLQFALMQFGAKILSSETALSEIIAANKLSISATPFIPIVPPVLIRSEMFGKMGYLKKTRSGWDNEEVYFLRDDDLALVGTSEQSIGPMHAGEIFSESDLPRRYLGFSSCFRREAGSYGRDTKGILRVHQFDKLEMFSYVRPEDSAQEHRLMLACEEYFMQKLKLPYRVLNICSGDLGAPAAAKYDVEAWLPGQNQGRGEYRETHSTSNTTDFQARRLNIRYKLQGSGRLEYVHMLNGTALAMGRMIIAIIENYQTKEGKIMVPEALQEWIGKSIIN
jgi:seryl-tRNA synthetase